MASFGALLKAPPLVEVCDAIQLLRYKFRNGGLRGDKLFVIREYSQKDIITIVEKKTLFTNSHTAIDPVYYAPSANAGEEFKNYIVKRINDSDFKIFIAKDGGVCIGYVMGWIRYRPIIYHKRKVGYLSNIYVDETYKKSGVGKKLCLRIENWFKKKNVDFIEVSVDVRNNRAINSFKHYGYNELSITLYKHANSDKCE